MAEIIQIFLKYSYKRCGIIIWILLMEKSEPKTVKFGIYFGPFKILICIHLW